MSKVKIKFIMSTIFCGVFLLTISTTAMYDDRTDSIYMTPKTSNVFKNAYKKERDTTPIKFNFLKSEYSKQEYKEYKEYMKSELFKNQENISKEIFYKRIDDMYENNPCSIPDNYQKILNPYKIPAELTTIGDKDYEDNLIYQFLPFIKLMKQCGQVFYIIDKKEPEFGENLGDLKNAIKEENRIINFKEIDDPIEGIDQMFTSDFCCIENLMNNSFNKDNLEKSINVTKKAIKEINKYISKTFEEWILTSNRISSSVWKENKVEKFINGVETHLGAIILRTYSCIKTIENNIKNICEKYKITIEEEKEEEEKEVVKYELNDLCDLDLNKMKDAKVRVKPLIVDKKRDEHRFDYYDVNKKTDLLDLYIEQLNCYIAHFYILTNKKMRYDTKSRNTENQYLSIKKDEIKEYVQYLKYNADLVSKYEKINTIKGLSRYQYKRSDFMKDRLKAKKIISDLKALISSIYYDINDEDLINKIDEANWLIEELNLKIQSAENEFEKWRKKYDLDNDNIEIKTKCRNIDEFCWHFNFIENILKNKQNYELNDDDKDNPLIVEIERPRENKGFKREYYVKGPWENFGFQDIEQKQLFKNSLIYSKYYQYLKNTKDAKYQYRLNNLKEDIKNVLEVKEKMQDDVEKLKDNKEKDAKNNSDQYILNQFDELFQLVNKKIKNLTTHINFFEQKYNINKE